MLENVIISIKGRQFFDQHEPDAMELVTSGTLEECDGGYTLSYQESELTGLEGTTTVFHIRDGQVTLMREGEVNSLMVFEEGRRHLSMYDTPYGALAIGINTRRMRTDLGPLGGDIEIQYAIEVDHALTGLNLFQIHVARPNSIAQ